MSSLQLISILQKKYQSQDGYGLQKETEALMEYILKDTLKSKLPKYKAEVKNSKDSMRYRKEGNQCYLLGDVIKAIEYYTKSLAYADNEKLMAYAYANRSAALFRQKMFRECLMDVDAALSLGYSDEKPKQLEERRVKAFTKLQKKLKIEVSSAKENESVTSVSEEKDNKSNSKEIKPLNSIEEDIYKTVMAKTKDIKKPRFVVDEGEPKLLYGPSKEAPAASNGVKIVFSEEFGRHLVATRNFNPGDIITMEEPYMYLIDENRFYTHCHHCLSKCYNLIPCHACPIAQYCSEECRKTAWNSVHNIECSIWVLCKSALEGVMSSMRVLRKTVRILITLTKGGKKIEELRQDMAIAERNTDKRTAGFTDEGIVDSSSARSILSLTTNIAKLPRDGINGNAHICTIAMLLLATQTNFLGKQYLLENLLDSDILSDLIFCAALLLRGTLIMCTNGYSIQHVRGKCDTGHGLYMVHSLYNHSCEANTFFHFDGLKMITRARSPIRPGEGIFGNYGPSCADMPKRRRQMTIASCFFFECKCQACLEDWPTNSNMIRYNTGSIVNLRDSHQLINRFKPLWSQSRQNKYDIKSIKAGLKLLYNHTTKPCVEILGFERLLLNYYMGKLE